MAGVLATMDQAMAAKAFPAVAVTPVGAEGTVAVGVTGAEGAEAGPVPKAFVAVTVNVYVVPIVSPTTVHESMPGVVQVAPPGAAVAV